MAGESSAVSANASTDRRMVAALLADAGDTFADDAGITLRDKPEPLFELLVLTLLVSARISSSIAVAAARELFAAGWRDASRMADAPRRQVVAALGRAGYARYDESTARALAATATTVIDRYHGDLRELAAESHYRRPDAERLLQQFTGIGPVGAAIFLREVQDTWTWVRPFFDAKGLAGAARLGLPTDPAALAALAPPEQTANLAAALVRAGRDTALAERVEAQG
ncbi:hypothetical protein GCM10009624_34480 [Gordonia sinesedis]